MQAIFLYIFVSKQLVSLAIIKHAQESEIALEKNISTNKTINPNNKKKRNKKSLIKHNFTFGQFILKSLLSLKNKKKKVFIYMNYW